MKNNGKSKQVNNNMNSNKRANILISPELHRLIKIKAATQHRTMRSLLEEYLWELLGERNAN